MNTSSVASLAQRLGKGTPLITAWTGIPDPLMVGASGIIAPMINSAADARQLAAYTKFPPIGERSWGPAVTLNMTQLQPGDYLKQANQMHVTIAMVETREALAALDDILAVDGIDGVLVGPSDLSIALSNGGHVDQTHADVFSALDHVLKRCRHHKKAATVFTANGQIGRKLAQDGFDLLSIGTDILQLRAGAKAAIDAFRKG